MCWGQYRSRYSIHASRQLSDKVLRYLKRVIVTPAVYESFVRLNPVFRYSHWAGITDYTSPFGVAVCYVVIRQSERSCHCDLPNRWAGTPYPKVTGLICRVPLTHLLPTRLRLLSEGHQRQFSVRTVSPFSRAPGISIVTPSPF